MSTDLETFNSIFEPSSRKPKSPADVIYTLSNTIDALQGASSDEADLRWEVIQESASNSESRHLDPASQQQRVRTIEDMVSQLRPFRTPPPPVPMGPEQARKAKGERKTRRNNAAVVEPEALAEKKFKATIILTESTSADGVKYYTAQTTPIVRIPTTIQEEQESMIQEPRSHKERSVRNERQPFLERMRQRQERVEEFRDEREGEREREMMYAISVKRQRKLKMKKHKYKKLMKRTRNLRRRLDRA